MRTLSQTLLPAQLSRMADKWQHCRLPPKYMTLRIGRQLALGGKMLTFCVLSKRLNYVFSLRWATYWPIVVLPVPPTHVGPIQLINVSVQHIHLFVRVSCSCGSG